MEIHYKIQQALRYARYALDAQAEGRKAVSKAFQNDMLRALGPSGTGDIEFVVNMEQVLKLADDACEAQLDAEIASGMYT